MKRPTEFLSGFTLIELLVVMAIILVLTLLAFPNYRLGEKLFFLEQSTISLAQNLRRAETSAMSAKEFQGIIPRGGYGLYLRIGDDYYTIFADCDQNYQYTLTSACNGFPEKVEEVKLGSGVAIANLLPVSPLTVVFTAPTPLVTFSGPGNEATIVLALTGDAGKNRTVKVNKAGLIETQ